jgi:hypothetical protein
MKTMKAFIINARTQQVTEVKPKNGKDFQLEEMREYIGGGYIEIVTCHDRQRLMVLDEEGKLKGLPVNILASTIYGNPYDVICGDVLVCQKNQIK